MTAARATAAGPATPDTGATAPPSMRPPGAGAGEGAPGRAIPLMGVVIPPPRVRASPALPTGAAPVEVAGRGERGFGGAGGFMYAAPAMGEDAAPGGLPGGALFTAGPFAVFRVYSMGLEAPLILGPELAHHSRVRGCITPHRLGADADRWGTRRPHSTRHTRYSRHGHKLPRDAHGSLWRGRRIGVHHVPARFPREPIRIGQREFTHSSYGRGWGWRGTGHVEPHAGESRVSSGRRWISTHAWLRDWAWGTWSAGGAREWGLGRKHITPSPHEQSGSAVSRWRLEHD